MHIYPIDIFYDDTDALGIVYHANFVKYLERARTMYLQSKGFSLVSFHEMFQKQFVVKRVDIEYFRPVRLQQRIHVSTKVSELSKATLTFDQKIYFDPSDVNTIICTGNVVIVCTNTEMKPCAIPERILRELKSET